MTPFKMRDGTWIDLSSIQVIHKFPKHSDLDHNWLFYVQLAFQDKPKCFGLMYPGTRADAKMMYDGLVEAWEATNGS